MNQYDAKGRSSGSFPFVGLPVTTLGNSDFEVTSVTELTAAGQLRIYTGFPFNPSFML